MNSGHYFFHPVKCPKMALGVRGGIMLETFCVKIGAATPSFNDLVALNGGS